MKKLVQVRSNWVGSVGQRLKERPRGEVVGLPDESVYKGIGDGEGQDEDKVEGVVDSASVGVHDE